MLDEIYMTVRVAATLNGYAPLEQLNSLILASDGRLMVLCDTCLGDTSGMVVGVSPDLCDICNGGSNGAYGEQLEFSFVADSVGP